MRRKRVVRLFRLIQALQSGRAYSVDELADLLEVNRRTIFRDVQLLAESGIRYTFDRESSRYQAVGGTALPPVQFTVPEATALLLMSRRFVASRTWPDEQACVSAAHKIESLLPAEVQDSCSPLIRYVEVGPVKESDTHAIADALHTLQRMLAAQRKVWVEYDAHYDSTRVEDELSPYRLLHMHRGWYLVAHSRRSREVRTFKIERIVRLFPLDETYRIPEAFSIEAYFGNAWCMIRGGQTYNVRIRFLARVAGNVDEIAWHKTQRTLQEDDGSLLFEADVEGLDEISWWVLGYGDQAQVLDPPELRELVAAHAANMLAYYRGQAGEAPRLSSTG